MDKITLRQLRYFDALAKAGHFGRAADACAISQPALSIQIKDLERDIGVPLFERGPRQVRLTAQGEDFAHHARSVLAAVTDLTDWAQGVQGGGLGRLRLGIIPTIAPYMLPRLLGALAADRPTLDIHVRETITPRLIELLTDGALDAAIVALPTHETGLHEATLFAEELVLVRHADDPDMHTPTPDALRDMRLLLLEEGHCFRDHTLSFCNIAPTRPREGPREGPRDGLDGSALSTLVQMVGAGIGVTLIPEMAIPVETRAAPVRIARFAAPAPTRTIGLVWRRTHPLGALLADVADIVRKTALDPSPSPLSNRAGFAIPNPKA